MKLKTKEYQVKGMHCAACKNNVENAIKKIDGIKNVSVNLMNNTCQVEFIKDEIDFSILQKEVSLIGYELIKDYDEEELYFEKKDNSKLIKIIIGLLLMIPLLFFGMGGMYSDIIPDIFKNSEYGIYYNSGLQIILSFIIIGLFFKYYINGFKSFIKFNLNMDSLVFLGSLFSLIYSFYIIISTLINHNYHYEHFHLYLDSASMILVIVSIGKYIEELSKNKAKSTIKELINLRPKIAHLIKNDEIIDITSKNIQFKDILLIKPGETIPCDGIIISGVSSVDESLLTGESLPILKKEDDYVIGGSINKESSLKILVNKSKEDNVLSKIIKEVENASNMKSPLTRIVDKVSRVFIPIVIILALITFFTWLILGILNNYSPLINNMMFNNYFDEAFTFGVGVLVISCPCALGLATPISLLVGSSIFSKNYILVQNGEAIEKIKDIDTLVLDKTNTITEGKLSTLKVDIINKEYNDLLSKIYSIEKFSEHPIAKAITNYLSKDNSKINSNFLMNETLAGYGIKGSFKNKEIIYCTNYEYLKIINKNLNYDSLLKESSLKGELPIFIYNEKEVLAIFYLKDKLKEESKNFILNAKKIFKRVILLTGDNKNVAEFVAKEVGIDEVISEVKPTSKDEVIYSLQKEGYKVMMVGDGINDSIALTRSDVGIGIAKGSDIALASSDFILMKSNLNDIFKIIKLSKNIRKNIYFNLFWAFIYNLICIPIAAGCFSYFGIILSPMYCSMLMALSSITVCLNSLTLFLKKIK